MPEENEQRTLRVLPNIFAATDAKGRPIAVLPHEGRADAYVGVQVDHERTKKLGRRVFLPAGFARTKETKDEDLQKAWDEVGSKPVVVPDTPYYRNALSRGTLLPADEEAAAAAGPLAHPTSHAVGTTPEKAAEEHAKAGRKLGVVSRPEKRLYGREAFDAARERARADHEARYGKPAAAPATSGDQQRTKETAK